MDNQMIGLLSGIIVTSSIVPYAIRVWQRKVHPNLTSWSLWAIIGITLLITFDSSGAKENVLVVAFGAFNPFLITVMSIWLRKKFTRPEWYEIVSVTFCLVSFSMWLYMVDTPRLVQYALYVGIFADAWAAVPTIVGYIKKPEDDRPLLWIAWGIGFGLSMFAIEDHTIANYSLPVYMIFMSVMIVIPLTAYRIKNRIPLREWI